jgi:signal transduction histidine kinase/sensor domain CHASE-containing protein
MQATSDENSTKDMLSLEQNKQRRFKKAFRIVPPAMLSAILCIAGLIFSYQFAFLDYHSDLSSERDQVALKIDQVRNNLSRELYANINLAQGIVDLVRIQGGMSQSQFNSMARELTSHSNIINNFAFAPDNIVRFIYPLKGNESALGLNYRKNAAQLGTILRAMAEQRTVVAGPVKLVQGGIGIIGRTPIYISVGKTGKAQKYWGIASTVLSFDLLIKAAELDKMGTQLRIALRGDNGTGSKGNVFWGDPGIFKSDPVVMDIALPSGSWQIAAVPISGWSAFSMLNSRLFIAGMLISLVLSVLLFQDLSISQSRAREIAQRQVTEVALRQKNRALELFSQCNSAVVNATKELPLLKEICRIAVESAGYRMAWVGRAENDPAHTVKLVTYAGNGEGFIDQAFVSWADNEHGHGTAGTAIRTRKPVVARDLYTNPNFASWRELLRSRDYASAIAMPLIVGDEVYGVMVIYAAEQDAFDTTEVSLLEELGHNISHGIMAIHSRKERDEALSVIEKERNELEKRVVERTQELLYAKEAAESADRLKSAFLATMSHELRTPLNSIIGFTGIILQRMVGPLNDEQIKQLNMVNNSARHLLDLINDVLDISKIEAGQLNVLNETFHLPASVEKVIQSAQPLAEKKGLKLSVKIDPQIGLISSDRRRVEQILLNLISNAIKFTEEGSITVICAAKENKVILSVHDTGIGIKNEDMGKLFNAFQQIESGLTRKYDGTGLGLSISKKLAELLGGKIIVESVWDKGSTFSFILSSEGENV